MRLKWVQISSSLPKLAIKPWIKPLPDDLVLTNARVVQPSTGSIMEDNQTITIRKGIIVSVKSADLRKKDGDGEILTVDLNGAFVCP